MNERALNNRREFLTRAAGAVGASLVVGHAAANASPRPERAAERSAVLGDQESDADAPLFRISLAQWSLHRRLRAGDLQNLDFAPFAREHFGIDAVEYVNSFFGGRGADFEYLRDLRRRADDAGVRTLLIMVDGEGALGDADDGQRRRAVEQHFKWIAASAFLGGHAIRVNAGGSGDEDEVSKRAAESLHRLCRVGADYGIDVIVENHGGLSSDGAWLAKTIERADHPGAGTLPDFGNFHLGGGRHYDRYRGVAELMPYARAVSAKAHEFDADGNEVHTDYRRMLEIVIDAGYRGYVGIEWEGKQPEDEVEGIRLTQRLLERVREQLAGRSE
jgi:L-ribulose-5-phosphate 3-epimerase